MPHVEFDHRLSGQAVKLLISPGASDSVLKDFCHPRFGWQPVISPVT